MPDREKVVKGLENCLTAGGCHDGCPYHDDIETSCNDCLADALALLKAQEPRVMALEELRMNEVYWAEQVDVYRPWPIAMHHIRNAGLLDGPRYQDYMGDEFNTKEYGKKWRCWTACPTREQMKAVKWE